MSDRVRKVYDWNRDVSESKGHKYLNLVLFLTSAMLSLVLFLTFYPHIDAINRESTILINLMFGPALAVGFIYGVCITEKAIKPSETRSPFKRSLIKIFLFFFVIGGMFSSANFAINGGSIIPDIGMLENGLLPWLQNFIFSNGGATFLIVSSITLMATATKRMVGMNTGVLARTVSFLGTFVFFSMLILSFTKSDPTSSGVFLYTFYQAGVVGGALYEMNKLTRNQNRLDDFVNGY